MLLLFDAWGYVSHISTVKWMLPPDWSHLLVHRARLSQLKRRPQSWAEWLEGPPGVCSWSLDGQPPQAGLPANYSKAMLWLQWMHHHPTPLFPYLVIAAISLYSNYGFTQSSSCIPCRPFHDHCTVYLHNFLLLSTIANRHPLHSITTSK